MTNLYVVESPLQALCALEVALGKENESHAIIVRVSRGGRLRNDKQILDIVSKIEWDFKSVIRHRFYNNRIVNSIEDKNYLLDISKVFKNRVCRLYIGEFRSPFMHMVRVAVKAPQVFLLDDGAASVKIINNYIDNGYYYPYDSFYPTNKLKKIIFKIIYGKYIDFSIMNRKLRMLTAFSSEENNNIEKTVFKNIKVLFNEKKEIDNSLVYYYGSKYSEVAIINLEYEIYFLKKVFTFYSNRGKVVTYFAHRDESQEKLKRISKEIGFEVVVPNVLAELYLLKSHVLPIEVSGAYTSILNNTKLIFPEISVRSFKLSSEEVCRERKVDINLVYDYYRSIGITVES